MQRHRHQTPTEGRESLKQTNFCDEFPKLTKNSPSAQKPPIQCKKNYHLVTVRSLNAERTFYTCIYFSLNILGFSPLCASCLEKVNLVFLVQTVLAELYQSTRISLYLSPPNVMLHNSLLSPHFFNSRTRGMWKFQGQGLNHSHICDPRCSCANPRSFNPLPWTGYRTHVSTAT